MKPLLVFAAACPLILGQFIPTASGQPEVTAWGNLTGLRVDGQRMAFETSLCVVGADWEEVARTAKERQRPHYTRDGDRQIVATNLDSLFFTEVVTDSGRGRATVEVTLTSRADTALAGAYFCLELPGADYGEGTVELVEPAALSLAETQPGGKGEHLRARAGGVRFASPRRQLAVRVNEPTAVIVRRDAGRGDVVQVYLAIATDSLTAGQTAAQTFTLEATGEIDRNPIALTLDPTRPGRVFDGLGGNFRLQNPNTDPPVIQYALDNLRVAWGRVEMPWRFWHPEEGGNPLDSARAGRLHPRVQAAMEMAQRLDQRGIPVILSDWSAPEWALVGPVSFGPRPDGVWGNPLDSLKTDQIYASITAYISYLKEHFGVEVAMFSFNESDLGIYVRQTGEEHARLIKGLGAYFAANGLKTKLLLGDTADANGYAFIEPAMADSATYPYIGAVSFHSWRGWAEETLARWDEAAERLGVPLVVGEGSIDAAAWRYPAVFEEPTYALEEINLYTRILAICQPLSILQWQLTADYSALAGGGVFGNDEEPLHPTQRFWNLKQLASTPAGLRALPIACDSPDVTCAALGDSDEGIYAVHLVNNGTTRQTTLSGLPRDVGALRIYVTDHARGMEEGARIPVSNGQAQFTLDATSYTTLLTDR